MTSLTALGTFRPLAPVLLPPETGPRRRRTWEMEGRFHCSIIGTCLTTSDVRHLLRKLKDPDADRADEHALHVKAVRLASDRDLGGKLLNKALDRRHEVLVRRFARARSAAELRQKWQAAEADGDIPAGYWAVLSHPQADIGLMNEVFGAVHMLSHLVGRSTRADIRRIRALEAAVEDRDARLGALEGRVARLTAQNVDLAGQAQAAEARARLAVATVPAAPAPLRRAEEPDPTARLRADLAAVQERLARMEAEQAQVHLELAAAETVLQRRSAEEPEADLAGATVLYVGGRPGLVDRLHREVAGLHGRLLAHDGGQEDARSLLPGLIGQADVVVFPVDCVSHWAMGQVKRACATLGKPFVPLRTASLACFLAALPRMTRADC